MARFLILLSVLTLTLVANVPVGTITSLHAKAFVKRDATLIPAAIGLTLFEHDTITTHDGAKLQIVLTDKSTITMGAQSSLSIKKYLYQAANIHSTATIVYNKGFFRTLTGYIAQSAPQKFVIKTNRLDIQTASSFFDLFIDTQNNFEIVACNTGKLSTKALKTARTINSDEMLIFSSNTLSQSVKYTKKAMRIINQGLSIHQNSSLNTTQDLIKEVAHIQRLKPLNNIHFLQTLTDPTHPTVWLD